LAVHNSTQTRFERFSAVILAIALLGLQASCESIIGLEDRTEIRDGGPMPGKQGSALCSSYCSDVLKNCKAPMDAYKSMEDCQSMCQELPPGADKPTETKGNTVSCRAHYAKEAGSVERDKVACPAAAPGGGSPGVSPSCGNACEGYCGLYEKICSDHPQKDCMNKCRAIPDNGGYSASMDYLGGDTLQCRIAHLNAAAQAKHDDLDDERNEHCGHALLRAGLGERPFCDLPNETEPTCPDYCKLVMQSCKSHPIYEDQAQCEKVCEGAFVKGKNTDAMGQQDINQDTLACRRWHAYYAFDDAGDTHCPHTGPLGDGHCGKICPAYCSMLNKACSAQFKTEFPGGMNDCLSQCMKIPGYVDPNLGYDLNSEESRTNTLQCRTRYLVDAFNGKDTCAKAFPKGTCAR
jgi:hypothetical protein